MFKKVFIGLVVLVIAAVIAFVMSINTVAKTAIEAGGSRALGTDVSVSSVNVSLLSQSVRIEGLTIANPEGFTEPTFLSVGAFDVKAEDLMGDPIIINSILLNGTKMNVEISEKGNNVKVLTRNMKASEKSAASSDAPADSGAGKKLVIRDLKITGTSVSATLPGVGTQEQNLPDIHMTNLGTEEQAIEPPEAVRRVMAKLNEAALEASQGNLKDQIKQKLQEKLGGSADEGGIGDSIKGIFGK